MATINLVFTRPEFRRRHYAENLVYQVTKIATDLGYVPMLYTDADYAASNACYEKIGYVLRGKLCTIGSADSMEKNSAQVSLRPAVKDDMKEIWKMQVEAFSGLLEKYQDFDLSPASESFEKVMERFEQPWTKYYFIVAGENKVGVIRVVDKKDGSRKRISPIWIMPEYRNKGYAQSAILEAEKIYGPEHWSLDTILQEKGNLHLYEKLGYRRTGKIKKINERMDIVFYEKD